MVNEKVMVEGAVLTQSVVIDKYAKLLEQEAEIKERKRLMLDSVKDYLESTAQTFVEDENGKFMLVSRKTLSWTLDSMKEALGRRWTLYVKPDDAKLKLEAKTSQKLAEGATETVKQVVTFIRK